MIKQLLNQKIDEIFLAYQNAHNIKAGDINPHDALELEDLVDSLAYHIEQICKKQPKEIDYDKFAPSWYIYTDCDGDAHDVVYGHDDTNEFFRDVSHRICFGDCADETVEKIFWQGKEVHYAGWQHGMKFEYKDLNGNTVWVGYFEHWDH